MLKSLGESDELVVFYDNKKRTMQLHEIYTFQKLFFTFMSSWVMVTGSLTFFNSNSQISSFVFSSVNMKQIKLNKYLTSRVNDLLIVKNLHKNDIIITKSKKFCTQFWKAKESKMTHFTRNGIEHSYLTHSLT